MQHQYMEWSNKFSYGQIYTHTKLSSIDSIEEMWQRGYDEYYMPFYRIIDACTYVDTNAYLSLMATHLVAHI